MKLAFTGDTVFCDIQKYTSKPFEKIIDFAKDINLIINLESPFLPDGYKDDPIKKKMCLKQKNSSIFHLKMLTPFLVNLSNNHINDYGNFGAKNTQNILLSAKIPYFGAGFSSEKHNLFVYEKEKIIFLSYATRSIDLSGSKLFNEKDLIGPKEFTFKLLKDQVKNYDDYKKIVLFHWGLEQMHYPLPQQRIISKKMIEEVGIDLIIGNHSHVIQAFEKYKSKYIFYSLGNFLFPHCKIRTKSKTYYDVWSKKNMLSIMPIFEIQKSSIVLDKVITIKANNNFELEVANSINDRYNHYLFNNMWMYSIFYFLYSFYNKSILYLMMPIKFVKKRLFVR